MGCQTVYDEMMSLQLDGLLDTEDERHLLAHLAGCGICAPFWDAMKRADTLLIVSSHEPIALPSTFTLHVMGRIAQTTVMRPQLETELVSDVATAPVSELARPASVLPAMKPVSEENRALSQVHMPEYLHEWQSRIASYVRSMTAIGLTLLGAAGLVLAAVITGTLRVDGPIAPAVQMVRTFIVAVETWIRTLFSNVNSDVAIGGVVALVLLALAGWQIVSNYYRSTTEHWLDTAVAEAA